MHSLFTIRPMHADDADVVAVLSGELGSPTTAGAKVIANVGGARDR